MPEETQALDEERTIQSKRHFLEAVSHYLETPVASMVGLTDLLQDRSRDSSAGVRNQMIELLGIQAAEVEHIVRNLVLAATFEMELSERDREPVRLRHLVEDTIRSADQAQRMAVTVSGDAVALADKDQVRFIIRNLLHHAQNSGGQNVWVRIGRIAKRVTIDVVDDGPALDNDTVERAFEPFHSYSRDGVTKPTLGLSLGVARRLAKAQGGDLVIKKEGDQTVLELTLPGALGHQVTTIEDTMLDPSTGEPTETAILDVVSSGGPTIAYQPIVAMRSHLSGTDEVIGYESLARFPHSAPPEWFEAAGHSNLRLDLELSAINAAIAGFDPPSGTSFLALNLSDVTLTSAELDTAIAGLDPGRVVLELSEVAAVKSYELTNRAVRAMRERGVRLAIDDVGSGEIDLWHILRLEPALIKIDLCLVRDLEDNPKSAALIRGIAAMSSDLGIMVVAEGVETTKERDALFQLGVEYGQGYLFGKPAPLRWKSKVLSAEPHTLPS